MLNLRKLLITVALFLLIVIGLLYVQIWFSTATIKITSSPEARILIKQADETFREIGTGQATLKTRKTNTVFIEARLGESVTQKSLQPKRRSTIQAALSIKALASAEAVAPGPFIYPLIENDFIHGINSNTRALDVKHLSNEDAELPALPLLPYLKQIAWQDSKNYIYITASKGAGVTSTNQALNASGLPYTAVASPTPEVTALIGRGGLYLAKGLDIKNTTKVSDLSSNTATFLFADSTYLYAGWLELGEQDQSEASRPFRLSQPVENEEHDPGIEAVQLLVFDHTGVKAEELKLPITEQVFDVVSVGNNRLAVLAGDGVHFIDLESKEVTKKDVSFGEVRDMAVFSGRLLLLGPSGLWEYDINQEESYKLANYPRGEQYVPNSLTVFNGALYFSSSTTNEELKNTSSTARSRVFKVAL